MVLDGNRGHHGRQGHVVNLIQRGSLMTMIVGAWMLLSTPAFASHVANDGLPQRPTAEQPQHLKLFDWRSYVQVRYTHTEVPDDLLALRRFKVMLGGHLNPKIRYFVQALLRK